MSERTIVYTPLSEVLPALRNPKKHSIPEIKASIARLGFIDPVIHDGRTGLLIAGHGRLESLLELENEHTRAPDGIRIDIDKPGQPWCVPVVHGWVSKNDAEVEAAIVALNSLVPRGGWDDELLGAMLSDVAAFDPELLAVTAYNDADIAALLEPFEPPDFKPLEGSGGGLDEPKVHECPACKARWVIDAAGDPSILADD